jgi:serine/threonine-protein kinase
VAAAVTAVIGVGLRALERRRAARRVGPYVLLERLGSGAAGSVWRARSGRRLVALKVFDGSTMLDSESRGRFFREARAGSEIDHPNVVRMVACGGLDDGRYYLAMDLVPGATLASSIERAGQLPPARASRIAADVARGLAALHAAGIVHRDVKPDNVIVTPEGRAVLTDLGLARSVLFRTVTRHDVAVGTLAYMSPEQCVGWSVDPRTDLWSLGVTLYQMLTGSLPFVARHELELVYSIHNVAPPPPSRAVPGIPAELDRIVARCLERAPERRFADATSLAAALDAAAGEPRAEGTERRAS